MAKCSKHGDYHSDHGCGTAVNVGSSYADHSLTCPKSPAYKGEPRIVFAMWEAPAGNCPTCWHASAQANYNKKEIS